jgi:hypothetical protein
MTPCARSLAVGFLVVSWPLSVLAGGLGLAWLGVQPDPRGAVLGEAMVAHVGDASAALWNPAGLIRMEGGEARIAHTESFGDLRREFAALARNYGPVAVGAHFSGIWTENTDAYDEVGNYQGTFGYYGFAAGLSAALAAGEHLRLGAGTKILREAIDVESATGWAVDLGLQWSWDKVPLELGFAVLNLGPEMSYGGESFAIPTVVQAGASYRVRLPRLSGALLLAADIRKVRQRDSSLRMGVEYTYRDAVSLGFGYRTGVEEQDLSVGFGLRRGRFRFQYALVPFQDQLLGEETRLGLSFQLW